MLRQLLTFKKNLAPTVRLRWKGWPIFVVLLLSFGGLIIGKAELPFFNHVRLFIIDHLAGLFYTIKQPFAFTQNLLEEVHTWRHLRQDLENFKTQNQMLRSALNQARNLKAENILLRQLLKVVPDKIEDHKTVRVLMTPNTLYSHNLIVGAGTDQGITKGFAVITDKGIIGRIIEVGEKTARVLLITDANSRVPVLIESTRDHAILTGNNSGSLVLMYAQSAELIKPGERLITSGYGGVFPPGVPIGVVKSVADGMVKVQPMADLNHLDFVRLVRFMPQPSSK